MRSRIGPGVDEGIGAEWIGGGHQHHACPEARATKQVSCRHSLLLRQRRSRERGQDDHRRHRQHRHQAAYDPQGVEPTHQLDQPRHQRHLHHRGEGIGPGQGAADRPHPLGKGLDGGADRGCQRQAAPQSQSEEGVKGDERQR